MTKKFKLKKDPKSQEESRRYDNPIASREFILQYFNAKRWSIIVRSHKQLRFSG